MSKNDPAFRDHLAWLGYLQPDGLVVSPAALVDSQIILDRAQASILQQEMSDYLEEIEGEDKEVTLRIASLLGFLAGFLKWPEDCLFGKGCAHNLPLELTVTLPELGQELSPTLGFRNPKPAEGESPWLILIKELEAGSEFDHRHADNSRSWNASEQQKFERLLRETQVPVGILTNREELRLVYAPRGESTGHVTFPIDPMCEVQGRLIIGAFYQLLKSYSLITAPTEARLFSVLRKSRDYQANVSTKLAEQVVEALYELLRGFQSANEQTKGALLNKLLKDDPNNIYRGLLNTLLRLVFLLYAEDRGLMPTSSLYVRNYAVHGLFERLRADNERYPDTMDNRFGAWSQLLALFRLVHNGSKNPMMQMPPRSGYLFDPKPCPFLEGETMDEPMVPLVPDGTLFRVLSNLLLLDGERLSYKTLDVEQIGSVYETIMGFQIEQASGRMIALKPKKRHGAPLHIDLDELLTLKPKERDKLLKESADTKLPAVASKAFKSAQSVDELLFALEKRIDRRASPRPVPSGAIILQPTDERRRSGSHYTPRSFTEPIVRKTLEPILDRMGRHPKPEAILDLKVADIAVGSAAFLVEVCRQLADELVASWHFHKCLPMIPPDEDEVLFARRKIAQRCLYGVDRNSMAVDLAKLSLWLATMAKDHPFTFLDHSIKSGDSLVGLTNKQIAAFHWDLSQAKQRALGQDKMERAIQNITKERKQILDWPDDNEWAIVKKREFLAVADQEANRIRTTGDLAIAAFFAGSKPKERQSIRNDYLEKHLELQSGQNLSERLPWQMKVLEELGSDKHPVRPFHWELEFPEVFLRENPGFDAIVGNPPFAGKNTVIKGNRDHYLSWLKNKHSGSHGNADLVSHFFRKAYHLSAKTGVFGLISSNSIGQGDTRTTGLYHIRTNGGLIYNALRRVKWPGDAAVIVSVVHVAKSEWCPEPMLDGKKVSEITSYLLGSGGDEPPRVLAQNANRSFIGHYICGPGFTFDDSDSSGLASPISKYFELIKADENIRRIHPYIGGEEVLNSPTHSHRRWVIDFEQLNESQAREWSELFAIIESRVKPSRESLPQTSSWNKTISKFWWRWGAYRHELARQSKGLERVLFHPNLSANLAFTFISSETIVGAPHNVICLNHYGALSILQCQTHESWARRESSSFKDDLRYAPTDCFETFPFPPKWEDNDFLEAVGKEYYEFRANLMVSKNEGLTKTYNRFQDPDETSPEIQKLRELHAKMDRKVLDAYGWIDIPTDCEFLLDYEEDEDENTNTKRKKKKPWRYRWPDEVRDEVLARLLALNQERYQEEVALGLHAKGKAKKKTTRKKTTKGTGKKRVTATAIEPVVLSLPEGFRFPSPSPELYAIHLVTAILSQRPEGVFWQLLRDTFAAVTQPDLMQLQALAEDKKRVEAWAASWNEQATPANLIPALKTMTGANLATEGEGVKSVFSLQDGAKEAPTEFITYDAWLALRVIEPLSIPILPTSETEAIDAMLATIT